MSRDHGKALLILGMHRSGTSYLARLMQSLGVFIGDELVGPQKGNPRGHFEARPMLAFHERLIQARLGPERRAFDDGMLVQEPLPANYTEAEKREAGELLDDLRRSGAWGWKEPRTCLFLDFWKGFLPDAEAVIVYRHPLEVHQSLLRRGHWDLALFPDQAFRAFAVYSRALLRWDPSRAFVFNANAGFSDPAALAQRLADRFNLTAPESLPVFHPQEFSMMPVSRPLHRLAGLLFPESTAAFDALQERASIPFAWASRDDDEALENLVERLTPIVSRLPAEGRARLAPLLDWWSSGTGGDPFARYAALAREIGERVQRVEAWNREAAEIHRENKRLAADYEKMGRDYARQQEFLARQAATQEKVWAELKRTGESWTEQKALIEDLLREKRALLKELESLRGVDGPTKDD